MSSNIPTYQPNRCYFEMMRNYKLHHRPDTCLTFCNEGGSRSGKTFDAFDFIADLCAVATRPLLVYVLRDTLVNCKDYTLQDFKEKMRLRGLYDDNNMTGEGQRPEYRIFNSIIRFRGLDKMGQKEGFPSDIVFINEALSGVEKEQYDSVVMRCKLLNILDWNPRFTEHWAFNLEGQPDVFFTHTTFRDNKHCPKAVARRIMAYEPTPENIEAGTADEWRWKVYGLGIRAAQEGLIYPSIKWIDSMPDYFDYYAYGVDFGFTHDPTAIVKVGITGRKLYIQELFYSPVDDPVTLDTIMRQVAPEIAESGTHIVAIGDTADKYAKNPDGMVSALALRGLNIFKAIKGTGSIITGITRIREFDMYCVDTRNMRTEAGSYVWDSINGIPIGRPIDKFNHLWDAVRYVVQTLYSGYKIPDA